MTGPQRSTVRLVIFGGLLGGVILGGIGAIGVVLPEIPVAETALRGAGVVLVVIGGAIIAASLVLLATVNLLRSP